MSDVNAFERARSALIAEITAAFDGVSREEGTTLHEAIAIDDWASPDEQRAARRLDIEARWQDVPEDDIFSCCSALSFLDEKGFRYYLPAFMIYGLKHWGVDWRGILGSCEYHLLHEYPKSLRKSDPASIAGKYRFTDAQSKVIARLLRFLVESDESAERATVEAVEKWERYVQGLGGDGV